MIDYYTIPEKEVLRELKSSLRGLTDLEAEQRLHKYGFNELTAQKGIHPLRIFFEQFYSPIVWVLIVALVVSIFLNENIDAVIISVIVVLNAILGFTQEYRAEKSIEALKRMASPKARVVRGGNEIEIESKFLVPGDIILVETGDKVPADARIIQSVVLETQEAPLTGESLPVKKKLGIVPQKTPLADRFNMLYASSVISKGRGMALVTGTGMHSEMGKIATLIHEEQSEPTPLQKKLGVLGRKLAIMVVIVAIITFAIGVFLGQSSEVMLLTAIALAVAAIPEGLPAVITISLALGVQRMVKKNALVRTLPSVEGLGSVNVICTDKTGTLTHNQMTVTKVFANNVVYDVTGSGYTPQGDFLVNKKVVSPDSLDMLLKIGVLCNDAKLSGQNDAIQVLGDPTEAALIVSAAKGSIIRDEVDIEQPRKNEIPFSSERKMMTTIHQVNGLKSYTKGAPEVVLGACTKILVDGKVVRLQREHIRRILEQNENFAKQALRVLGFAYNDKFRTVETAEKDMIFVGLQAMMDPPRDQAKESIKKCEEAGIRVIMITGDHLSTAVAVAKDLGLTGKAITGPELSELNLTEEIEHINIFARVNPEHKLHIVKALQSAGYIVAMTGDGVNDAPALKRADIGISMGITGTDVANEASDMILTDDNFTTIVNAVEEGRGIFDNIRKFVNYLLSSNLAEILVIFLAMVILAPIWGLGLPLTPIHILWINLVTDGLPALALSADPYQKDIMKRKPRNPKEHIISHQLGLNMIIIGTLIGVVTLFLFWLYRGSPLIKAQTIVFTSLVVFEVVRLQMIRSEYKLGIFSNKWLIGAVIISLALQIAVLYTPLNVIFKVQPLAIMDWVWILLAASVLLVINKIVGSIKSHRRRQDSE